MSENLVLSPLNKTWVMDLDGTIVKHNGYKLEGEDSFLPGALDFLRGLAKDDFIVFLTSRPDDLAERTEKFLRDNGIRYDRIIYGAPYGERILINDTKPSGLNCAYAINVPRDHGLEGVMVDIDPSL